MNETLTRVEDIGKLGHREAMRLAQAEYERFGDVIRAITKEDWAKPTDNDRWNVEKVVSHVIAMADAFSSFRVLQRQQKEGKALGNRLGLGRLDRWTEVQALAYVGSGDLAAEYEVRFPRALRRRDRLPAPVRMIRLPSPPYGWFSFAYLLDDILTRDVWMHRVDVSRAIGREIFLTPEHDGRFVANIVRDLSARWKRPFTLVLGGPAGGTFVNGSGGAEYRLDAVEFCRVLSGRAQEQGLPTDVVPF